MKSFKSWKSGTAENGFTLIEVLIVIVILAVLAGVIVISVGGVFGSAKTDAYDVVKEQIQTAVTAYAADSSHPGEYPYNASAATFSNSNCSTCYIINMSMLLVSGEGMLREVPDGCIDLGTSDNCAGGAAGCKAGYHYLWGVDINGSVHSFCDNSSTSADKCMSNSSGYQGVWP